MPARLRNHSFSPHNLLFFNLFLSINFLFFSTCHSIDAQCQALLTWKNSLNISKDALKSWNSADQSPCNWFGIHCNSNGDVIELSLKSVALKGPLPSNFQQLKFLNVVVLSSTNLTGTIPKEFGDYLELILIDISDNSITGEIPMELCKLNKLETLSLNSNLLKGNIPSDIGNLYNLKSLRLYDNQLGGEIPRSIGKLNNLEIFRAGGNQNLKGGAAFGDWKLH
ncbi:Leucine-rich receptor-like protein kinase family protein [Abeliophyllum distichum]|uniref:Leucine-rich receptor-like protein kinase family protein n=1 Tax=Abeliophyllum distichum TaxID=126358 RepID=A0ABD1UFJ8_9LAMI